MASGLLGNDHQRWFDSLPKRASTAALFLENESGELLIVKANYKNYWTVPGGFIDPGETPKEAAMRETLEEVGIDVHPETVEFVAVVDRHSDYAQTYQFIFKAPLGVSMIDGVILQASEIDEYALVSRAEIQTLNRHYGKVITHWANGAKGYIEQTFGEIHDAGDASSSTATQ